MSHPTRRVLVALLALFLAVRAFGDDAQDRRAHAGIRLFRALLAADTDLPKKAAGNQLLIVFYYVDDKRQAADLASRFAEEAKDVRGLAVTTEVTNDPSMAGLGTRAPAGIFIAQAPARAALTSIIQYGIGHHVIVYSPFEGHVELGVLGGLSVEAQVRPFLNRSTLEASQISLKPFFLSVAKVFQ